MTSWLLQSDTAEITPLEYTVHLWINVFKNVNFIFKRQLLMPFVLIKFNSLYYLAIILLNYMQLQNIFYFI